MRIHGADDKFIDNIHWEYGTDMAKELLEAIQLLGTTNIKRIDGEGFKAYWAGEVLRIDIDRAEMLA